MQPRLIVIDPSFTSHEGDRWQYAVDLAKSAHALGYSFVLLTHRTAPRIGSHLNFPIEQRNIFQHAFYVHEQIYERHKRYVQAPYERRLTQLYKERLELLDRHAARARDRDDPVRVELTARKRARLTRSMILRGRLLRAWAALEARRRPRPFNRDDFALALAREVKRLAPGPADKLFFHTMTYGMMESLSEVTLALGDAGPFDTDAYFLFHFGAEAPDARTFLDRYYSYAAYGSIGDRMRVGSPFKRLHYLATCEELCEEAGRILGAPVSLWHGLVDMRRVDGALGSHEKIAERRAKAMAELEAGRVRLLVRAADLDPQKARAVSRSCHLIQHRGNVVRLRVLYHRGSLARLRDIMADIDFPNVDLVDTESNDAYVRELAEASLVLLTYDADKYDKRVSAVLHDCAVMAVPALVPAGTTLARCDFAAKFVYASTEDMLGAALNAIRSLVRNPTAPQRFVERAVHLLARNALTRLLECSPTPSMVSYGRAPMANVVMPLWGRVGSSFAIEGQIRYLLERGYFVNQVFIIANPTESLEAFEYFWKILRENARNTRGSVQRVAFVDMSRAEEERRSRRYRAAGAFDQFQMRIARSRTEDKAFDAALRRAELTVVNHVFHSQWAFAHTSGKRILETHDIQSYQMVNWPLLNEATMRPESIEALLPAELNALRRFDHVINVAPDEHAILSRGNANSTLITPYLPEMANKSRYASIKEMGQALGWHESYKHIQKFDLMIAGDSHPANRESAVWFINEVFKPMLAPRGISLALVGRLSDAVHQQIGGTPYVFYVGFVDDIDSIKALNHMAVLPDRRGTGISIKTLEAFATGMPFVGTSVAFRGLRHRLPPECQAFDQADAMAGEIIRILEDSTYRRDISRLAKRCYDAVAGKKQFDAGWDQVLDAVLPGRRPMQVAPPDSESGARSASTEGRQTPNAAPTVGQADAADTAEVDTGRRASADTAA